ncbi:DNA polymerase-3 subunit delta' [Oxalobacteraceae bacterium GrIS 2.11]
MSTSLYPWQSQAWTQIQQLRGRWPHAILIHGPEGIGKTVFAEWLAQSLLCEAPQGDGQACGSCVSCGWFAQYSHPDFRRLRPEVLEADGAESEADDATAGKSAAKAGKAPSKEIVINQVRSLAEFMTISTHRQGVRAIVIYPAEAMNVAAANALLKSLEEPGPNTVFILVTHSVDALLPTMVSRCHQFALTVPSGAEALDWLNQQGTAKPEQFLAEQGGSPLAAFDAAQSESYAQQEEFLLQLQRPNLENALKIADKLQKTAIPLLLSWMQRWLYDVFSFKLTGKIRYYPRYQKEIKLIASGISLAALLALLDTNTQRRAVADHPLSAKLVIEDMLLDYVTKCQQRI